MMMNPKFIVVAFTILLIICVEGRKTSSRSRGSGSGSGSRGSSKKVPQPAPTSFSYPQPSAPKPSFTGWQERPAQKSNTQTLSSWQSKPSNGQSHSYPSSGTGLSGNKQTQTNQESIQRSSASNNYASQQGSHSYPASTGLSGNGAGSGYPQQNANKYPQQQTGFAGNTGNVQAGYPQTHGAGYPSGTGLSGGNNYPQQHNNMGGTYPQQSGVAGYAGAPPPYPGQNYQTNYGHNNYHPQGPPPPYSNYGPSYGGFGGHSPNSPGYGSQMPGYFGNYGQSYGGVSRTSSALKGVGIAGAGIGTVLTGLALWNLARSTGQHHHTVIYDNRGQPVAVAPTNDTTAPVVDSILADLVNCSLTISNDEKTEVLAIPCAIATSFTPDADVKEAGINENKSDNTKCTVTVLTKAGKEFMTTIPCSILLNSAAENNVTEPPLDIDRPLELSNGTIIDSTMTGNNGTVITNNAPPNEPTALKLTNEDTDKNMSRLDCSPEPGEMRDPINPCYAVNHNLTVIPLPTTDAPK